MSYILGYLGVFACSSNTLPMLGKSSRVAKKTDRLSALAIKSSKDLSVSYGGTAPLTGEKGGAC
jgi:hypothetical protein